MAFGRSRKRRPDPDTARRAAEDQTADAEDAPTADTGAADTGVADADAADTDAADTGAAGAEGVPVDGPFDIDDFDDPAQAEVARLDLGSVLIPVPETGQLQVELTEMGVPSAIWVVTQNGRFTIAAYAAPKSPGLWREVASELAEALRKDAANVSIEDGPWGREVVGAGNNSVRFVGVDGYRWMIRCVINGAAASMAALAAEARNALADTVVRRGDTPLPVRTPLPVQLPEPMAAQLRAAADQAAQQQPQQATEPEPQPTARRAAGGSAMQQLRTTMGG